MRSSRNHLAPRAAQHHHVRVVDHDPARGAREVAQRVSQKHLAVEALERRVALKQQHPRVTQHRRRGTRSTRTCCAASRSNGPTRFGAPISRIFRCGAVSSTWSPSWTSGTDPQTGVQPLRAQLGTLQHHGDQFLPGGPQHGWWRCAENAAINPTTKNPFFGCPRRFQTQDCENSVQVVMIKGTGPP
jgi:hypothetical protein